MQAQSTCSIPGCEKPRITRGWCVMHYHRWRRHGDTLTNTPEKRFWAKVNKNGPVPDYRPNLGPCWLWIGAGSGKGYRRFWINQHTVRAHRFAYEILVGPIPAGLELDHLCRIRHCVNPAHLEPVPGQVNTLRGISPSAQNAKKTRCPKGHPYDEENTRLYRGRRYCRACSQARDAARHLRHQPTPTHRPGRPVLPGCSSSSRHAPAQSSDTTPGP